MWLAVVGPKDAPPPDPFAAFPPEVQAELAALRAVLDATRSWCDPSNLPLLDTLWQQAVEDQAPDGPAAVRALLEHLVLPLLTRWLAAREANPR